MKNVTNWQLARRDLLKHLGVGAGLPAAAAGDRKACARRRRPTASCLMVLQMSEGYRQQYWKPATGPLGTLPRPLMPLEAHKADMIVCPGHEQPGHRRRRPRLVRRHLLRPGRHRRRLQGADRPDLRSGGGQRPAQDRQRPQVADTWSSCTCRRADHLGRAAPAASGPARASPSTRWAIPTPLYKEVFAGGDFNSHAPIPAAIKRLMANKKSILDFVGAQPGRLQEAPGQRGPQRPSTPTSRRCRELETQLQSVGDPSDGGGCLRGGAGHDRHQRSRPVPEHPEGPHEPDGRGAQVRRHQRGHPPARRLLGQQHQLRRLRAGVAGAEQEQLQEPVPQLARPGPQPDPGRRGPQADRRPLVHGPLRRAVHPDEGVPTPRAARCSTTPSSSSATTCRRAPTTTPRRTR